MRISWFSIRPPALAMLVAAACALAGIARAEEEPFESTARQAILIEAETGTVLYAKNADALMPPSSMAKLMTVELVFKALVEGRLALHQEIPVSADAWRRGGAPSRSSTMYLEANTRVRVENILRGIIVQSGNDASIAVAEALAGSEAAFARQMTERARELGMPRSVFRNSTGLPDPKTQVTARELATLARHLVHTYPKYYPIYAQREFTWNNIRQPNRNPLLDMDIGADGMKTGYTKAAGYGLVGSAVQDRMRLIIVINGLRSEAERAGEARRLLEWGFGRYELRQFFRSGEEVGAATLFGGERRQVPLLVSQPVRLVIAKGTADALAARIIYRGPVVTPVARGQEIGRLEVSHNGRVALDVPVEAAQSVEQGSVARRAFDGVSALILGLWRAGVSRI